MRLLIFFCLLLLPANAQDTLTSARMMKSGPNLNGRFWNSITTEAKAGYLHGVLEAIADVPRYAPNGCACAFDAAINAMKVLFRETADPATVEIIEELDVFFKVPANRQIPIIQSLKYVALKMSGAPKQQLDDTEAALRREAARYQ